MHGNKWGMKVWAQMQEEIKFLQLAESYRQGTEQGLTLSHRKNTIYSTAQITWEKTQTLFQVQWGTNVELKDASVI